MQLDSVIAAKSFVFGKKVSVTRKEQITQTCVSLLSRDRRLKVKSVSETLRPNISWHFWFQAKLLTMSPTFARFHWHTLQVIRDWQQQTGEHSHLHFPKQAVAVGLGPGRQLFWGRLASVVPFPRWSGDMPHVVATGSPHWLVVTADSVPHCTGKRPAQPVSSRPLYTW